MGFDKTISKGKYHTSNNGKNIYTREINKLICNFLSCIEDVFTEYSLHNTIPTTSELKELVNEKLGRFKKDEPEENKVKTLKDIFSDFLHLRPKEGNWGDQIRHMFCFMAFTSLRYSDLAALKPSNLIDGCLDFCTEKTDDKLHIVLNEHAMKILDKYVWYKGETLFSVPSNQKLNDYLKEAAKMAGLNRKITQVYFKGSIRYEDTYEFWEQISCHDARRTFVCCSLALGIPPSVVMSCTGHSDYESMKPYIEVADEGLRGMGEE